MGFFMREDLKAHIGTSVARAAAWMTLQAKMAEDANVGTVADLRRYGVSEDALRAGLMLHVELHRLAVEMGQPSALPKVGGPAGITSAAVGVAGAGLLALGYLARWCTQRAADDAERARAAQYDAASVRKAPAASETSSRREGG